MAAANPVSNLCEETTCLICLEYFKDPVIIDCGHIFCQKCITQCWNGPDTDTSCPQCREPYQQRNIRPIRQLASIVEIAKKFSLQTVRGAEVLEEVCQQHQEPLKLFCEDDQILICVVCDKSKEHRQHKVIPKKEAFEEYKNKIWYHLKILKKERQDISTYKQSVETEMQRLLVNIETKRRKIVTEFKQLHEILNKKEQDLLTQLQCLNKEIQNISNEKTARLSEKISSVETDIKKMEEKHNQPENELLQDVKEYLKRYKKENIEVPRALFLRQWKCIERFGKIHNRLQTDINTFKATILPPTPEIPKAKQDSNICKDMKIPSLVVEHFPGNDAQVTTYSKLASLMPTWTFRAPSEDIKLSCLSYTMGFEKITSGCHSWEVEMENTTFWAVGVAKESLRNSYDQGVQEGYWFQGVPRFPYYQSVKEGNWAICLYSENGIYKWTAFTSPKLSLGPWPFRNTKLQPVCYTNPDLNKDRKKNIRVILDYENSSVIFTDESDMICSFNNASFSDEPISSWVSVGK